MAATPLPRRPDFTGAIPVVTYTVNDGSGSPTATDTSTLTLAMAPVNDAPLDGDESATVTEDATLSVPAATGLLANFTDVDSPLAAATVTSFLVAGNPTPFAVAPGTPGVATIAGVGVLTLSSDGSYSFAPAPGLHRRHSGGHLHRQRRQRLADRPPTPPP